MIDVLGVLMGVDMQGFSRPEGSDDLPPDLSTTTQQKSPPSSPPTRTPQGPSASASKPQPSASASSPTEDVEMSKEDDEEAAAKKQAEAAKKAGSEAYKKREFDEAAKFFENAWELWPKDVTFLTNLAGEPYNELLDRIPRLTFLLSRF